jgi:hypothetical protein
MAKGTVNKVILLGRLGQNPEVRQTQTGMTIATLSLATNEIVKEETQTEWHRVVVFGKAASVRTAQVVKPNSKHETIPESETQKSLDRFDKLRNANGSTPTAVLREIGRAHV